MILGENSDTLHDLFATDVQYEVPRYQRRYVWDETNWRKLWEDILTQWEVILAQEELSSERAGHFTGNIVTRSIGNQQLPRFEIIDGQQRLATFQIIFSVIRDICESKGYQTLVDEAKKHLVNSPTTIRTVVRRNSTEGAPDPTYKFLPSDYDKFAFQTVIEGNYSSLGSKVFSDEEKLSQSILKAYDFFYKEITTHIEQDCDENKVNDLIAIIKSDFTLVQIILGKSDQPEKIFESLNATGRMLSEFDFLRNHLFLRVGKLGVDEERGERYSDIYYDNYWHFENDSHYWTIDRLDSFFQAFLMAKLGPGCLADKSLKPFDVYRLYSKEAGGIENEFQHLKQYAESYKNMKTAEPSVGLSIQFYECLNLPSLDPFLLFSKHEAELSTPDIDDLRKTLESYIVRRLLCYGDREYSYTKINDFFHKVGTGNCQFCVDEFKEFLLDSWPDDSQVRSALQLAGAKAPDLVLYILYRIEHSKNQAIGNSAFESLNLLHINGSGHSGLGNITLCTSAPPEDWDSMPFEKKKDLLNCQVAPGLKLTEVICSKNQWNKDVIDEVTSGLFSDFCKNWERKISGFSVL